MPDTQPITEARSTDSRLSLIQKLLNKAEGTDSESEREALTERAASLMAKYGIDRAMLAESGQEADPVCDEVIFTDRPYAKAMSDLLWYIAQPLGAEARMVKQWDPEDHGGRTRGAWHYGLRLFAHESDLLRIKMLYASLRNQAIAGASRIKGEAEFGQDQRAFRISYLTGFAAAVWSRLDRAEKAAKAAREAEQQELADQAMLTGATVGRSVELVLADRRTAVKAAMDLALYNITPAKRAEMNASTAARRAEQDRREAERRAARAAEHEACERCQSAKSGYCAAHRDLRPVRGRQLYQSVGSEYYWDGHQDGQHADLGSMGQQVSGTSRKSIS